MSNAPPKWSAPLPPDPPNPQPAVKSVSNLIKENRMASFKSILTDVGKGLEKFFTGATKVAIAVEPIVDIAFPGIGALYNLTVKAAATAETASIAAGKQSGSGAQKLAFVVQSIEKDFATYAQQAGIQYNSATVENWVNAVVASLNVIPTVSVNPTIQSPAS